MNRDEGREVSPLWLNAIKKIKDCLHGRGQKEKSTRAPLMVSCPTRTLQPNPPATQLPDIEDRRPTSGRVGCHTPRRIQPVWRRH